MMVDEIVMNENTGLGKIEISPEVIQVIAGYAVKDIPGVVGLGSGSVMGDISSWLGRSNFRKGVRVELGERVEIEVSLVVSYGFALPKVGRQVQEKVKSSVEMMTGLEVEQVLVRVEDVKLMQGEQEDKLLEAESS
ncbi:MAG: hypothetical protein RLZ12_99 [Bacillota bacterium]|jgi:uncharacterized alkaline shock family protein YloU